MPFFRRRASDAEPKEARGSGYYGDVSKEELRKATKTRKIFALLSSILLVASLVFIVLVELGNTADKPVLRDTWFIRLDLSNVIPKTVQNSAAINSMVKTMGLHDFYQAGLWNFCEGYFGNKGITHCSNPKVLFWFNPIRIVENELLSGATLQLPSELHNILSLVKGASNWIFGLYLAGACLTFLLIFLAPIALYSKLNAFFLTIVTSLNAIVLTAASGLATAMYMILKQVFVNSSEVNIGAEVGTSMFAFMWLASIFAVLAFLLQLCMMCCCVSRNEVKSGRKHSC